MTSRKNWGRFQRAFLGYFCVSGFLVWLWFQQTKQYSRYRKYSKLHIFNRFILPTSLGINPWEDVVFPAHKLNQGDSSQHFCLATQTSGFHSLYHVDMGLLLYRHMNSIYNREDAQALTSTTCQSRIFFEKSYQSAWAFLLLYQLQNASTEKALDYGVPKGTKPLIMDIHNSNYGYL